MITHEQLPLHAMHNEITQAIQILKEGGIVIFPTDTAFGIGCRMDKEASVKKLFSIRRRPNTQAVPVLFDTVSRVESYVTEIADTVRKELIDKYWPGALTIILPAKLEKVPEIVRGGGLTIGTRIPAHAVPVSLIQGIDVPLIGTSANLHGDKTPYLLSDIKPELFSLVDYLISGTTSIQQESTVIDCSSESWTIKRQGAVKITL